MGGESWTVCATFAPRTPRVVDQVVDHTESQKIKYSSEECFESTSTTPERHIASHIARAPYGTARAEQGGERLDLRTGHD